MSYLGRLLRHKVWRCNTNLNPSSRFGSKQHYISDFARYKSSKTLNKTCQANFFSRNPQNILSTQSGHMNHETCQKYVQPTLHQNLFHWSHCQDPAAERSPAPPIKSVKGPRHAAYLARIPPLRLLFSSLPFFCYLEVF